MVQTEWPTALILALGSSRAEPVREAEQTSMYAAEELNLLRRHFQALVDRALDHLRVLEENRSLREEPARAAALSVGHALEPAPERTVAPLPITRFPRIFRHVEDIDVLMHRVVEDLADAAMVTRV